MIYCILERVSCAFSAKTNLCERVPAFSAKTNLCTSSTYNLLNSCCQETMDTSSSRSQQGGSGCWRRCKSASPTKRMWNIYISTFLNLVSCSRTSLNILILLSVYFFFLVFKCLCTHNAFSLPTVHGSASSTRLGGRPTGNW